jgi:hypothetical protein
MVIYRYGKFTDGNNGKNYINALEKAGRVF